VVIANAFPSKAEICEGLTRKPNAKPLPVILELAKRTIEVLVKEPVCSCRMAGSMFLDSGSFKLPHYPVMDVHINGQPAYHADVYEEEGLMFMGHAPDSYEISYEVGYVNGTVPAVIKSLVTVLSRYLYSGSDEFRSEIAELVMVARRMRQKVREKRNGYKVDREGSREGLARYSSS